jgi:hypothetical protein
MSKDLIYMVKFTERNGANLYTSMKPFADLVAASNFIEEMLNAWSTTYTWNQSTMTASFPNKNLFVPDALCSALSNHAERRGSIKLYSAHDVNTSQKMLEISIQDNRCNK